MNELEVLRRKLETEKPVSILLTDEDELKGLYAKAAHSWLACSLGSETWPKSAPRGREAFIAWHIVKAAARKVMEIHKPTAEQMVGCPPCDHDDKWCNLFCKKDRSWCEDCWTAYNIAKNLQTFKKEMGL